MFWLVMVLQAIVFLCVGEMAGEYVMAWRLWKAQKAGKIAVLKLPSKADIEAMLKKATSSTAEPVTPAPKKIDFVN